MAQFQTHVHKSLHRRDLLGRLLPLSSRQQAVRKAFYQSLKQLNRRGPAAAPQGRRVRTQNARVVSPEYLAGFIDAEGSLMLSKAKVVIRWNPAYAAKVYIDNTNKVILQDIQRTYGGTITTQPSRKAVWKPGYKLVWTGKRVERLLSLTLPYLYIKRSRAKILLRFIDQKQKTKQRRIGMGLAPLPFRVARYREHVYRQMKALNAKGPALSPRKSTPRTESDSFARSERASTIDDNSAGRI